MAYTQYRAAGRSHRLRFSFFNLHNASPLDLLRSASLVRRARKESNRMLSSSTFSCSSSLPTVLLNGSTPEGLLDRRGGLVPGPLPGKISTASCRMATAKTIWLGDAGGSATFMAFAHGGESAVCWTTVFVKGCIGADILWGGDLELAPTSPLVGDRDNAAELFFSFSAL